MLGAGDSTLKVFIQSRLPALTPLEDMMLSKNEVYHHIVEHIPITSVCVWFHPKVVGSNISSCIISCGETQLHKPSLPSPQQPEMAGVNK